MTASSISIRLLGPVDIRVDGTPLAVDTRKAVALLAYLAATGRPASRESLAALLWPEADDTDGRSALRRTLSVLKSALNGRGIAIDRSSVTLRPDEVEIDLRDARQALGRARDHGHDLDDACSTCDRWLETAIALDRGPFMDGFGLRDSEPFDEWQTAEAEAYRRDLAAALERLGRSSLTAASWDRAIAAGRRWLELDPLHEPAHRLLMTAYAAAGEDAAAIRQYRECVRVLDAELGVSPLEATTEIYEAIRGERFARPPGVTSRKAPAASVVDAPGAAQGTGLVGRDAELTRLVAAVEAVGPDGRLMIIDGEPGIGKTRLARALVESLALRGATVLEARAYAGEAAIPYASIAELIRAGLGHSDAGRRLVDVSVEFLAEAARLVPIPGVRARPTGPNDPLGRRRLLEALVEVLTALVAGPGPGLLWLDDAHWADAPTLEAVGFLVRRLRGRPISVLLTWRREDLADTAGDTIIGAAEADTSAEVVTLGRLGRMEVETLARAALGARATDEVVDALFADSEGLPLYVAEVLADPAAAGGLAPGHIRGIDALIRSRFASTSEVARQVASAAAVIGRSFDLETVRLASGRGEEEAVAALEELTRRGLVREVAPADGTSIRYDFTHARLRDVAYTDLGLARRSLLHRRVADSLAAPAGGREGAVRWPLIAYHERLAGRTKEAAEAHLRAGEQAQSVYANSEAREHFEAALALGHPATGALHQALGHVLTLLGDYRAALAHLETAAALVGPDELHTIEHQLGRVHARRGDWERADVHL
ncbi:MAG: AAA family ATPase, partial [Candidatus Limnocylindrales bacterium]